MTSLLQNRKYMNISFSWNKIYYNYSPNPLEKIDNRLYSELVVDIKTQLSERDKQRFTVM